MTDRVPYTVAIPTYRGARHLAEALRGILAQREVAFELIVSDDRSDDDTLAIVRAEAGDRAQVEVNSERLGLAGNWNRCLARCRTPFLTIFHQDDVMRPGHLADHLAAFETSEQIGMVCGAADVIDDQGRAIPGTIVERGRPERGDQTFAPGEFVHELAVGNPVRCSTVSLRTQATRIVGDFNPSYRYVVDWDYWIRLARVWGVCWLAEPTVAVRWHLASETHRFKQGVADLEETQRLLEALHSRADFDLSRGSGVRRAADRRLARAYLNRAYDGFRARNRELARACFRRAFRLWPGILAKVAGDPRLALMLAWSELGRRRPALGSTGESAKEAERR